MNAFMYGFLDELEKTALKGKPLSQEFKRLGMSPAARKDQASLLKRTRRQFSKGRGRGKGSISHKELEGGRRWFSSFRP